MDYDFGLQYGTIIFVRPLQYLHPLLSKRLTARSIVFLAEKVLKITKARTVGDSELFEHVRFPTTDTLSQKHGAFSPTRPPARQRRLSGSPKLMA